MLNELASSSWDSIYAAASIASVVPDAAVAMLAPEPRRTKRRRPATPLSSEPPRGLAGWIGDSVRAVGRQLEMLRRRVAPIGAMRML